MFNKLKMKVAAAAGGASVLLVPAVALAEGETSDYSAVTSAVSTGLQGVQTSAMTLIGTVIPYALTVMGAVLVVTIGIKVFKKVSGK